MIVLHPTLAGAATKIERALGCLRIPGGTSDHLASALDHLKSASKLVASHRTVLVELEEELPEPGMPLFDEAGAPAPGAAVVDAQAILARFPVLGIKGADMTNEGYNERCLLLEDLTFAVRTHLTERGWSREAWTKLYDLIEELNLDEPLVWDWATAQVLASGDFSWPHKCADCNDDCVIPDGLPSVPEGETLLCNNCGWKRRNAAKKKAEAEAKKTSRPKASKKPVAPRNPLGGGDE